MITALRKRHRTIFIFLSPVLITAFVLALLARKAVPILGYAEVPSELRDKSLLSLPAQEVGLEADAPYSGTIEWGTGAKRSQAHVRLWETHTQSERNRISIEIKGHLRQPDLLLYWQARPSETLSPQALFIGHLTGQAKQSFELTSPATLNGAFVIYSLAYAQVLDSFTAKSLQ